MAGERSPDAGPRGTWEPGPNPGAPSELERSKKLTTLTLIFLFGSTLNLLLPQHGAHTRSPHPEYSRTDHVETRLRT